MPNPGKSNRKLTAGIVAATAVTGVIAASVAPAQAAQGQIRSANTADAVAGSYLVVLKDGATTTARSAATARAHTLAQEYGAEVGRTFSNALRGFSVHASETEAKRIAADDDVAYVVQNQRVHATDTQPSPPSWGLDRIDQRDLPLDDSYEYATKADNVTVYVIDTGVDADHSTFGGRVSGGMDFIDNDEDAGDENGHGTHVAGTIGGEEYGVAKGVQIVPVRVLDANGSGTTEQVVAGIDWVAQNASGPAVANMSLGGSADDALDTAVRGAIEAGVTFGVAAGNESTDAGTTSPARVQEAITVAASNERDAQASFSNYGDVVDLYAPGEDITSAWLDGGENTISGTSMATPHVVGAAALYLAEHGDATPEQVAEALTSAATPDKITNPGDGTPNRLLYTGN
ncbi:subtilisin-like serine protease [Saccharomonospora marina XMU15]|uniref:Subtilisin-like serine protease n=1 Tax=Saccharomonospora marina XMU15 TaxID=882083 RepID=H5X5L0_9PSEU|nr:S8 family peptidase [Saccharomonospora marina]EHR50082.1 subtilisin-like serine protease [Saccharomonospora marina XMU15]